ncbi:hypothetical protein M5689_019903 [Euphorbia peplus]|nr:hypothetical protein M5689_019903 [Euphorbia peplus]
MPFPSQIGFVYTWFSDFFQSSPPPNGHIRSPPPAISAQWFSFLEKINPTSPLWCQLLSSSAPIEFLSKLVRPQHSHVFSLGFDKLFVLTLHAPRSEFSEYAIWCLDVNHNSNIHKYSPPALDPILRFFTLSNHYAFVILGYKLYMFCGSMLSDNTMSIYDLRRALSSTIPLDWRNEEAAKQGMKYFETGPKMAEGKCEPVAVVIGEYRICVFSTTLYDHRSKYLLEPPCSLSPNFEIYDSRTNTWIGLPEPCNPHQFKLDSDFDIFIDSYCVYLSSLIIETNLGSIHGINLDNSHPKWVQMDGCGSFEKFPFKGMWKSTYDDVLAVIDPLSYPIALRDDTNMVSLLSRPSGVLRLAGFSDTCNINICSVRGGLGFSHDIPYLLVDILNFSADALKNLGSDCPRWNEIQSDKAFTFSLSSIPSRYMRVINCFPVKDKDKDTLKDYIQQNIKILKHVANKVALELETHSLTWDFPTSQTEGNGYFRRRHQAESQRTVAYGLQRILQHFFGWGYCSSS